MSSAYLRLLIFLLADLNPACASSSPAFLMMYSAYKLNKQGDNIQPWRTPFPIWNQFVVPCPVLTVASWPAYRFHHPKRLTNLNFSNLVSEKCYFSLVLICISVIVRNAFHILNIYLHLFFCELSDHFFSLFLYRNFCVFLILLQVNYTEILTLRFMGLQRVRHDLATDDKQQQQQ